MKPYQILAPAGSPQAMVCAVQNGADAVYFGLDKFNARMKADNFSSDNLSYWVNYCHLFGVKTYVTLNTSLKQDEFAEAVEMVKLIYKSNADGIILTDLALIKYAANLPGRWEIVASTQLNVHDVYGAQFLKELGATTVVLARETPLNVIKQISSVVDVKLESFLHGAMCVSQSGQCLLSAFAGGNSGNRGLCAQPCRKFYTAYVNGKKRLNGYLLSPKDMCGLTTAKALLDSGVTTFKIEGRNRRPAYAGETSAIYSKVFKNNFVTCAQDLSRLKRIYNRGDYLSDVYLKGDNDNVIYPAVQGHLGEFVGKIKHGTLVANCNLSKGDGFKVLRSGKEVGSAVALESGNSVKVGSSVRLIDDDACYLTSDLMQIKSAENAKKTLCATLNFTAEQGKPAVLTASCDGISATVFSEEYCQFAQNLPTKDQEVAQQLQKTGNTHYTITDIVIKNSGCFLPKSVLNKLRRDALESLSQAIVSNYNLSLCRQVTLPNFDIKHLPYTPTQKHFVATVSTEEQYLTATKCGVDFVIVDVDDLTKQTLLPFSSLAQTRYFVDLPPFANLNYVKDILPNDAGIVANNVGAIQFAQKYRIPFIVGAGLNVYNLFNADLLSNNAYAFLYSNELTLAETLQIAHPKGYKYVYGRVKLMHLMHCPNKVVTAQQCSNCKYGQIVYEDDIGNRFTIRRRKLDRCMFELINGKKLSSGNLQLKNFNYLVEWDDSIDQTNLTNKFLPFGTDTTKGRLISKVN